MSDQEIIKAYDSDPNMTLQQLAYQSGKSVSYLKQLLNN